MDLRDYKRAISDCDEALRLFPQYRSGLKQLGAVHEAARDRTKAYADYAAALALEPADQWALAAMARIGHRNALEDSLR